MVQKEFYVQLQVKQQVPKNVGAVVQNDINGNRFMVSLIDGVNPVDITGYTTITFTVQKPDNTYYVDSLGDRIVVIDPKRGELSIILGTQAVTKPGLCQAVIEVWQNNIRITSAKLVYLVVPDISYGADPTSESDYPALLSLMSQLSSAEGLRVIAEDGRVLAETGRVNNEMIRQSQEAIRQTNEELRKQQEDSRQASIADIESRFYTLTAEKQQDAEVIDARKGKASLRAKIDEIDGYLGDIAINVKQFGAKGDGVTDDTQAIQNALNAGNTIYFPAGTYLCNISLNNGKTLFGEGRTKTILKSANPNASVINTNQTLYHVFRDMDVIAPYEQVEPLVNIRGSRYVVMENIRVFQEPNQNGEYSYSAIGIDNQIEAPSTWVGYNRLKNISAVYCKYGLLTGGGLNSVLSIEDCNFSSNGYYNLYLDNVHVATIKNLDCAGGGQLRNSNIDKNLFGGIFIKGSNIIIDGVWYEFNPPYIENSLLSNNCYIHPDSSFITINGERTDWTSTHNFYMLEDEIKGKNTRNIVPQDIGIGKGKPLNILPNSEFKYLSPSNIPLSWQTINSPIITPLFDNLPIGIETGINIQGEGGVRGIKFNLYPNIIKNLSNYIGQEIILTYYYRSNGGLAGNGRIGFKLTSNSYLSNGDLFHDYFNTNNKWIKVIQRHKITGNETRIQIEIDCRVAGTSLDITQVICALDDHVIDANGAVITEHGGNILSQDFKIGGKRHGYGTTPPVDGEWEKGDIIYNTNPSPGGFAGWICITAGTPGTWKGFGLIEA